MIKDEDKKEIRNIVREENEGLEQRLAKKVIPENYTRCKSCGSVVKTSEPCPYCKKEPVKEKEVLDELFGDEDEK
jgi:rubrerythrin